MIPKYTFEDLYVGMSYTFTRKLTSKVVATFAKLVGDYHPLHVDKKYAIKNGFEGLLGHGFLLTGFLSYAVGMKIPGENAIILRQSSLFLKPAYIGETLQINCSITQMDKRFSKFTLEYEIINSKKIRVVTGDIDIKIRKNMKNA